MKKMKTFHKPKIHLRKGAFTITLDNAYKAFICITYCAFVNTAGFRHNSTTNEFMHLGISRAMNPTFSTTAHGLQIFKGTEIRAKLPRSLIDFLVLPNALTYKSVAKIATIPTKIEHLLVPNSRLHQQVYNILSSEVEKIGQQLNAN